VDVKVNGKTVTATIHLDEGRPTATRKSTILFTTNGYVPIGKGMRISVNIIALNDKSDDEPKRKNGDRSDTKPDKNRNCCARREGVRAQPERPGQDDIACPGRSKVKQKHS
jgi:hypothetical protein